MAFTMLAFGVTILLIVHSETLAQTTRSSGRPIKTTKTRTSGLPKTTRSRTTDSRITTTTDKTSSTAATTTTAGTDSTPTTTTTWTSSPFTPTTILTSGSMLTDTATTSTTTATPAMTSATTPTSTTAATSMCSVNASTLGIVPGQVGYLTSPNYPSPYYNNADCRYLITVGSGYVLKVTVLNVSLETGYDYLEIYNGIGPSSSSLVISTSSMPQQSVFYSSGQYMYIRFYSDTSVTYTGFRLSYEAVDQQSVPTSVCTSNGTNFTAVPGQVGYLTSLYYPTVYSGYISCSWRINTTSGYVVRATLLNVTNPQFYFFIVIYDGMSESSPTLGSISGMPSQTVYYSSGQSMYIRLTTYGVSPNASLSLTYEAVDQSSAPTSVCGSNGTSLSAVPGQVGYLTSLSYPSVYYGYISCFWKINTTSGYVVRATLLNVTYPQFYFYIVIYDGISDSSLTLASISGMPSQTVYYSSGQSMYIRLSTYGLSPNASFNLTYEAVDQSSAPTSVCGSNGTTFSAVPGQVGYLTSLYYPSVYSGYISCSWRINTTSGYVVRATLLNVTNPQFYFYIVIYDGMSESSPTFASISGMPLQTVYYSSGQSMYIRLTTYGLSPNASFNLTYEAVDQSSAPTSVCTSNGTTVSAVPGQVGNLTSPYYPSVYYGFISCSWMINSTIGYVVKATVVNVTNPEFNYNILILDGMSASSPTLASINSLSSPTVYYSSGQFMYIRLTTYGLRPNPFFSLTYEAVEPSTAGPSVCSVNAPTLYAVPGQVGYLTSPNYPSPYNNNADCRYLINAGSGYVVKLTVFAVNLETGYDYLEIYNGSQISSVSLIIRTSSMPSQSVFYSSGQYMYIRFDSDSIIAFSGFMLSYEAVDQESVSMSEVCPVNGTALSAVPGRVDYLRFPNHPSSNSNNTHCRWLINATNGDGVKMTILNASSDIFFYHIQIFDGMSESSPTLVTFYGMLLQTTYYSSGQYMYIRYTGYGSVTNSGLRVSYEAVNQPCGSTTTAPRASDPYTCTCSCVSTCSRP